MADVKYKESIPVDEPIPKGKVKAIEPGSDIRVDGKPLKVEGYAKPKNDLDALQNARAEAHAKNKGVTVDQLRKNMSNEFDKRVKAGELYAKGGMTASSRADGCAQRGKTKGTMVMCGGGMSK
jgi:hypothetical protein